MGYLDLDFFINVGCDGGWLVVGFGSGLWVNGCGGSFWLLDG